MLNTIPSSMLSTVLSTMLSTTLSTSPCQVPSKEAVVKLGYSTERKRKCPQFLSLLVPTIFIWLFVYTCFQYLHTTTILFAIRSSNSFVFLLQLKFFMAHLIRYQKQKKKLLQKRSQSISAFLQQMRGKEASQDSVADHIKKCLKAKAFFGIH